uniref:Protein yippee-like n=1 Tax=Mastacembelus armatus TaxID=205130 RepID=A0A3Q3LG82_9TELE
MVRMTRSKTFQAYLPSCHRTYSCIHCRAHLANHDELISKSFQGSQGRAYLFNSVVNVGCGPAEERVLLTGLHAVADIYCENCKTTLGWKYIYLFKQHPKRIIIFTRSPAGLLAGSLNFQEKQIHGACQKTTPSRRFIMCLDPSSTSKAAAASVTGLFVVLLYH